MNAPSSAFDRLRPAQADTPAHAHVPRPRRRWRTRVLLPLVLLLAAAAVLGYALREAFQPILTVRALPVIVRADASTSPDGSPGQHAAPTRTVISQAPGWVEPDPYAISVAALAGGTVAEVLVLEGEPVEAGQVVARMVDDDARLTLRRLEAQKRQSEAELARVRAQVAVADARAAEVRDDADRRRGLVGTGAVSQGEVKQIEQRLRSLEAETDAARAAVAQMEAVVETRAAEVAEAELLLRRMEIVSPVSGVVLQRLVEPGSRIMLDAEGPAAGMAGIVLKLYSPEKLQVRAEVPLADAAKVGIGAEAEVQTEAASDRIYRGRVSRIVHEANIQRNTVQVKVAIDDPDEVLRPEMLTRVKFFSSPGDAPSGVAAARPAPADGPPEVMVPESALANRDGDRATVWLVDRHARGESPVAAARSVEVIRAGRATDGYLAVRADLRPGDRVIVSPAADVAEGVRLRLVEQFAGPAREEPAR